MTSVVILVTEGCKGSSVHTCVDFLMAANYASGKYLEQGFHRYEYSLVGLTPQVTAFNGLTIGPLQSLESVKQPDILIIPAISAVVGSLQMNQLFLRQYQSWYPVLQQWQASGTIITTVCSGNLMVAAADLAHGRTLSCHWKSEEMAKELFPQEAFHSKEMLLDHGDLVSMGGGAAINNLLLYIIEKTISRELALLTAKLMLVEIDVGLQTPFSIFEPNKRHQDGSIKQIQQWLEENLQQNILVSQLAEESNMSERQFCRRFKAATGQTPNHYIQNLRIEKVKRELESSEQGINNIIWQAGYEDVSSFRRLFKRQLGMTMKEYRQKFGLQLAL